MIWPKRRQSDNDLEIWSKSNLARSQYHVEIAESHRDQSTKTDNLQSGEKDKGRKSRIPIRIKCMSQNATDSQKKGYVRSIPRDSREEDMNNINRRLELIEKALFPRKQVVE